MKRWLQFPRRTWLWYVPWHVVQHRLRGRPNGYALVDNRVVPPRFFCMWCARDRLRTWQRKVAAANAAVQRRRQCR